jgi:serine/threonine protein phosphatase PrpC
MSDLRLVVGVATDVGRVRDHNEDSFLVDDELGLFALADGMGGHRGGEVASATAIETLREAFQGGADLRESVVAANDAVFERSTADDAVRGMGTTLTAGVLSSDGVTLVIGHVGDSRAYLLRDGSLARVTTDHSLVEELMAAGELTEEEAKSDPRRSMITRAVGLEPGVDVDLHPVTLRRGDRLMFCSDGLTDMVSEDEIERMLEDLAEPAKAAQALVDAANDAGGIDNTTVLVVDVVDEDDIPEAAVVEEPDRGLEEGDEPADEPAAEAAPDEEGTRRRFGVFGRKR